MTIAVLALLAYDIDIDVLIFCKDERKILFGCEA